MYILALKEGQKRTEREMRTRADRISTKTIGMILLVLALPIMLINIALLETPNTDIGTSTGLLIVSNIMLFTGIILRFLPQDSKNKGNEERK